jgi:hypothetical protein
MLMAVDVIFAAKPAEKPDSVQPAITKCRAMKKNTVAGRVLRDRRRCEEREKRLSASLTAPAGDRQSIQRHQGRGRRASEVECSPRRGRSARRGQPRERERAAVTLKIPGENVHRR